MKPSRLETACAIASLVAVVFGILASCPALLWEPRDDETLESSLMALELAASPDRVSVIAGPPESKLRETLRRAIDWDAAFIAGYAALFTLVGALALRQESWRRRLAGVATIALGLAGAALDVLENREMMHLLDGDSGDPRAWSIPKWVLLFVCTSTSALVYFRTVPSTVRRWLGYFAASACFVATSAGICGVLLGKDALIETGGRVLAIALVGSLIYFGTQRFLSVGFSVGLDRIASWPVLRALASWPSDEVRDDIWLFRSHTAPALEDGLAKVRGPASVLRSGAVVATGTIYELPAERLPGNAYSASASGLEVTLGYDLVKDTVYIEALAPPVAAGEGATDPTETSHPVGLVDEF